MKATFLLISALLASLPLYAQQNQQNMYRGSLGAGVGTLYGFDAGIRIDYRLAEQITVNLGVGEDSPSPTVGAQIHIRPQSVNWQPRLGLHYGVVDTLEVSLPVSEGSYNYYEKKYYFKGLALELGQSFNFGASRRHGLDISFTLRLGDDKKDKKREELGVAEGWFDNLDRSLDSFNIGYRYNY